MFRNISFVFFMLCFALVSSEPTAEEARGPQAEPPLILILPPFENISRLYEKFLPLKNYLEKAVGRKIVLKVARDYREAIEEIRSGRSHLAYFDPATYCEARHRHGLFPLVKTVRNGSSTYQSVIVTRNDSGINRIIEGKQKRLALGNISSSSSYLIPAVMFKEVGISVNDFASVDFLEQEDRIALSVLSKRHDIGGLSERVAKKYMGDGLRVIHVSEAVPQYTLCASSTVPAGLRTAVRDVLLAMGQSGNAALSAAEIDGFTLAEERDFDVVRVMIKNLTGRNYLEYKKNAIKVAILPLYSAITLFDRFDPLMRYLSLQTGYEFKLVIPRDFEDFFDTVAQGRVQFSYSNPYIYIQLAEKGHLSAFANTILEESGDIFRGIIITHTDSSIRNIQQLRGKRVMVVSYKSAGGYLAQKLLLNENGIDVFKDLRIMEGKRQEEVILNVYRRSVDAGFVRESALDVLKEEVDLTKIRIVAKTPYIANWPFAATRKTDRKIIETVKENLLKLKDTHVLTAARIQGFKAASDMDFDGLRKRIKGYETR